MPSSRSVGGNDASPAISRARKTKGRNREMETVAKNLDAAPYPGPPRHELVDPALGGPLRSYALLSLGEKDIENLYLLRDNEDRISNLAVLVRRLVAREADRLRGELQLRLVD